MRPRPARAEASGARASRFPALPGATSTARRRSGVPGGGRISQAAKAQPVAGTQGDVLGPGNDLGRGRRRRPVRKVDQPPLQQPRQRDDQRRGPPARSARPAAGPSLDHRLVARRSRRVESEPTDGPSRICDGLELLHRRRGRNGSGGAGGVDRTSARRARPATRSKPIAQGARPTHLPVQVLHGLIKSECGGLPGDDRSGRREAPLAARPGGPPQRIPAHFAVLRAGLGRTAQATP